MMVVVVVIIIIDMNVYRELSERDQQESVGERILRGEEDGCTLHISI
jgi:hypothetical protein